MTRVPFHGIFLGVAGAWLVTLGACGRTAVGVDDYSTGASGDDDDDATSGNGGSSARGGSSSTTGGSSRGGTGFGGSSVQTGGTAGNIPGAGGSPRGGSSFGGGGGSVAVGGSVGKGGTSAVGGSMSLGGTFAVGGATAMGGSSTNGGTGAEGGTPPMPGGIRCGDDVCDPEGSVCCSRRSQPSFCTYPGADCQGATLTCSGPGTCAAGEVCCYHARLSFCTTECEVGAGEGRNPPTILLCDSSADCGPDETCVLAPRGIAYCGENL